MDKDSMTLIVVGLSGADEEIQCDVLAIFTAGDDDNQYIALLPEGRDDVESDIYLYGYRGETEDGQPDLYDIPDDEYPAVSVAFEQILDEMEFDELYFDEDDE